MDVVGFIRAANKYSRDVDPLKQDNKSAYKKAFLFAVGQPFAQ